MFFPYLLCTGYNSWMDYAYYLTYFLRALKQLLSLSAYTNGHMGSERLGKLPTITLPAAAEIRITLWLILNPRLSPAYPFDLSCWLGRHWRKSPLTHIKVRH